MSCVSSGGYDVSSMGLEKSRSMTFKHGKLFVED